MLRVSTGLRNALLSDKAAAIFVIVAQSTISFSVGDGPNGGDKLSDSGNGLSLAFPQGQITVFGSTSNPGTFNVLTVATDGSYIEVESGSFIAETAGAAVSVASATGGSFSDILRNGVIRIFPGTQPASADNTEGVSHLVEISKGSATFVPGGTNGINLNGAASGVISKSATEIWSGVAVATNTAGWFRYYDKDRVTGASTTARRFDGSVAQSAAQLNMSNTSVVSGSTSTIDSLAITFPTL